MIYLIALGAIAAVLILHSVISRLPVFLWWLADVLVYSFNYILGFVALCLALSILPIGGGPFGHLTRKAILGSFWVLLNLTVIYFLALSEEYYGSWVILSYAVFLLSPLVVLVVPFLWFVSTILPTMILAKLFSGVAGEWTEKSVERVVSAVNDKNWRELRKNWRDLIVVLPLSVIPLVFSLVPILIVIVVTMSPFLLGMFAAVFEQRWRDLLVAIDLYGVCILLASALRLINKRQKSRKESDVS